MKYKVTIIGHFSDLLEGQTIKTKIITDELARKYGEDNINTFNTSGGIKTLVIILIKAPLLLKKSENVIMLPAQNAVRVLSPLLIFWNHFYKTKLHYCVIGGWLPDFVSKRRFLSNKLKKFNYIYVETSTMKHMLEKQGFSNLVVMPNCKKLRILKSEELVFQESEPHKLCTFSRINQEKGIEDAIKAVKCINEANHRIIYTLDIYGQIDDKARDWFKGLENAFPQYVSYKGGIPFNDSVDVLKDYFALLFPTRYFTEGVPGTIIDAFAAGLPVIASKWMNYEEVIDEGTTGIGYEFGELDSLVSLLNHISNKPEEILKLRECCLKKYKQYSPEEVVDILKMGGAVSYELDNK